MSDAADRWQKIYDEVPLAAVPTHYQGMTTSPFLAIYLSEVLRRTPRGGRTLETGVGSGYGAVWLSKRSVRAEGIDYAPGIVERTRQVNSLLDGCARFDVGDLFDLWARRAPRYDVIHHQGVLEHFTTSQIRAALAQQVACAHRVVFSVPSVYYPFEPEFGDERLMTLDDWAYILEPFDVEHLGYYGDPKLGAREQILCVLRAQPATDELIALMTPQPHPPGISAIVHTRNEEDRIGDCLQSLQGWTDEIILCDMESGDETLARAADFPVQVIHHPLISNFDRARNVSAMRAKFRFVFFIDADERVPPQLGPILRDFATSDDTLFNGMMLPFRHHFSGYWMRSMYPGYTVARFLRNGKFHFNTRLHSGAHVDGEVAKFSPDDPNLAIVHYSFADFGHHLKKVDAYTATEAHNIWRDGEQFHWQDAVAEFVQQFAESYEQKGGVMDQVHGFFYAFFSGFYPVMKRARLFELRHAHGQITDGERAVPPSLEAMLEYALAVYRQKPVPRTPSISMSVGGAEVVWSGPAVDRSGYGDEDRHMLLAAASAGVNLAAQVLPWGAEADIAPVDRERIENLSRTAAAPDFTHILHTFGSQMYRHPNASLCIGRTTFETDRLPADWVQKLNWMDEVWVPSDFNKRSFADAGVQADKLFVIPECLDAALYCDLPNRAEIATRKDVPEIIRTIAGSSDYNFLSIFDWTLHKGWDVLLRAFFKEFGAADDVKLILKVWSSNGYAQEDIRRQAAEFTRSEMGIDLAAAGRVIFIEEYLSQAALLALYRSCDCFILPSRGEGWGRPLMEAMACGIPAIGPNWGGNLAFMSADNSYLIDSDLVNIPEKGYHEVRTYKGHRWAEPKLAHACVQMRRVYGDRKCAAEIAERGRTSVLSNFSREAVGPIIAGRIHAAQKASAERAAAAASLQTQATMRGALAMRIAGPILSRHSLGHVTREICLGLLNAGVELSLSPTEPDGFEGAKTPAIQSLVDRFFAPLRNPALVHLHHSFPPVIKRPAEGRPVLMQPWEYGTAPYDWIADIESVGADVWCNSAYVRDVYRNSGVPDSKLKMTPLGIDEKVFRPDAIPFVFTDEPGASRLKVGKPKFQFLYVGGTTTRKGFDILLDAYLKAFSTLDDVALIVKDTGTKTFYRDQNHHDRLIELAADPSRPCIIYLDEELEPHQLAGIYGIADCFVAPYRGEGFCLPVLEAMACGAPAIVPIGGATDDFVDGSVGFPMAARCVPFGDGRIGPWRCAGPTWLLEVDPLELAAKLREVSRDPAKCRRIGRKAAERARTKWTWSNAVDKIVEHLKAIQQESCESEIINDAATAAVGARAEHEVDTDKSACDTLSVGQRQATISLCMIVRNEELVIADCLNSIRPWVDEMIVVDTGSSDSTPRIAQECGAKVYGIEWPDSFAIARNVSLKHANGDWLFWMDADDTIAPEFGRKLRELVLAAEDRTTGFRMRVRIPPSPGGYGYTEVDHIKLFRNHLGLEFTGRIHEQILEPIKLIGGEVADTNIIIDHTNYDFSPEGQKKKRERDLYHLELDLADRPDHPFAHFNVGMTAYRMQDYPKAVAALERSLTLSYPEDSTVRVIYAMRVGCSHETGELEIAKEWLERGLAHYPYDPELLFRAGNLYRDLGDLDLAERSLLQLLAGHDVGHIASIDVSMTTFKAHHNLAMVYLDMGRPDEAAKHFKAAIDIEPDFAPSRDAYAATMNRLASKQ